MPIHDKSVKELMRDFAASELKPGQEFSRGDVVRWFADNSEISETTVRAYVDYMSVNSETRRYRRRIKRGAGFDLFLKLGPRKFRLWDEDNDETPRYMEDFELGLPVDLMGEDDPQSRKFAFERDLQNFLAKNLGVLEANLKLYQDAGGALDGVEHPAGDGRRIDILAVDAADGYVVIETKVGRAYDRVVGQILRYMAWVKKDLARGAPVRGIIVASEISEDLKLATSSIENIRLVEYEISFTLKAVSGQ